jgi:two-component system, chemotaxis family, sensor kinase CheA
VNEYEQAQQTFFEESRDMLRQIEDALLALESNTHDDETLNGLFRAAHTIKGSAGLFGFDRIGRFTHEVETVLDRLRAGEIALNGDLAALLLESGDHIGHLLTETAEGIERPETNAAGMALKARLLQWSPSPTAETAATAPAAAAMSAPERPWHLSVDFGPSIFRDGMDPLSFVRYLATKGDIIGVTTRIDSMPAADTFDPETCHLGFDILLQTHCTKADLTAVFDFVKDDCELRITAPDSEIARWITVLEGMPAHGKKIGEMLVACGAVTQEELDRALSAQHDAPGVQPPVGELLVAQKSLTDDVLQVAVTRQRDHRNEESRFIRVQADKLDSLITLVGELVIAGAGANLLARRASDPRLLESTQVITDLVEEIRNGALQMRMVQIGETFNRFRRVVRDVSRELGKEIDLEISGADTELDKSVVEKIADPLMHLVRNAMDHGIEMPDVRVAKGKPPGGLMRLNAFHDSGSIVIEVIDDGRGLDRDRILQKAWERGLVPANTELPDDEVFDLIFTAGFSTAEKVTSLSGRGVGMDVVRRNIEALRGTVKLSSRPGEGTVVSIRLPLTLAIIDGFLVSVGPASYVVPLDMVVECIELPESTPSGASYLNLRGQVLPFLRLREVFDIEAPPPAHHNVVVVRNGTTHAGLVVDRLLGEFQTVIKPLGKLFRNLQGIGGSTILGTGEVALILDVQALIDSATRNAARADGTTTREDPADADLGLATSSSTEK